MAKADKARFVPGPVSAAPELLFATAEEAWFWYVRAQRARLEGARLNGARATHQRPCEPDDIHRWVLGLYRRRRLDAGELRVLAAYGWLAIPPDGRVAAQAEDARRWARALATLGRELERRAIVAPGEP